MVVSDGHVESVYGEISDLESTGKLVWLDQCKGGQHWTTAAIAAEEAKLRRLVQLANFAQASIGAPMLAFNHHFWADAC